MKALVVMTVLLLPLLPAVGADAPPKPAAKLLGDLDAIEQKIKDLSNKEYGEVGNEPEAEPPARPAEGYLGVELLGVKQEAFVAGGVGGFWGKNYDKYDQEYKAALDNWLAAASKRDKCEEEIQDLTIDVDLLAPRVDSLNAELADLDKKIKEERAKDESDSEAIWELMDKQKEIREELEPLEGELKQKQEKLAGAQGRLPGLISQQETQAGPMNAAYDQLTNEESRLFLKWFNEK